jgi:hypothetical protein
VTGLRRLADDRRRRRGAARFLRFAAMFVFLLRLVGFVAARRRFFVLRFLVCFATLDARRARLFAASIFLVAARCAAVRRFFRLGGFTMNSVPMLRSG